MTSTKINHNQPTQKEQDMTTNRDKYDKLEQLETTIIKGLETYEARNQLIVDLVEAGERQADVARHINAVRSRLNAPTLTPDAIAATIKRVRGR